MSDVRKLQAEICARFGATISPPEPRGKVGIAQNVRLGAWPLNGLRHPPEGDTTGWYLWAGEGESGPEPDFFEPLHVEHLEQRCPAVLPYLALPPGWRFLIAPDHEDVWEDPRLLDV